MASTIAAAAGRGTLRYRSAAVAASRARPRFDSSQFAASVGAVSSDLANSARHVSSFGTNHSSAHQAAASGADQRRKPRLRSDPGAGGIALPLSAGLSDLLLPHPPSLSSMSPASIWTSLWHARVPRGFENFVPKKDKKKSDGGSGGESSTDADPSPKQDGGDKKESDSSSPFGNVFGSQGGKKQKQSSGGGPGGDPNSGGGGGPNSQQSLAASAVLLLLVYLMLQLTDDDNASGGGGGDAREITWSEFYNHMLEPGEVEKIVVTNKGTTARVFLKPGARGLPYGGGGGRGGAFSGLTQGRRGGATGAIGSARSTFDDEDETVMEMGAGSSSSTAGASSGSQLPLSNNSAYQPPLVYRFAIGSVDSFERKLDEAQRELSVDPRNFVPVQYAADSTVATELLSVLPSLLLVGVVFAMMRGAAGAAGGGGMGGGGPGGMFKFGKSNAKKISQEDISVTFRDVAGCQEAKKEIMEFVDFLQDSTRFTKLGAKIPKGALLCGPPGTGKTLLAKAVAGEAGVPFFSISGSDFIEMFVGVGPSRVRDLFKEARATAPCIIFIDEIDAIGRKRGRGAAGGNDERENTLNQLLVEMDGFNPSTGVVVLAGTNRVDILDEALTRPGRFDRQVVVDKPDLQGRKEIFLVHLQGITLEGEPEDVAGRLAGLTPGFAGADIANICNEAAIVAARRKADTVAIEDFEKATDRVVGGLESNKIISKEEREIVAHHEAGHAVAGWFLEHADPLLKVTIIPRSSGALGFAQYLPKEVFLRTEEQIMDIVSMALAGRAAEEVFFGDVTTGASDDLRRVTDLIYSTIQLYGMNPNVGQLAFPKDPNAFFDEKPYSAKTAKLMDEQAKEIVDKAYERTVNLIREKKAEVEAVAKSLLEKETIVHDDMIDLIGARPFKGDPAYEEFIKRKQADKEANKDDNKKSEDDTESSEEEEGGGGLTPGIA